MCGIAGVISLNDSPIELEPVRRMCDAMVHRGPDDEGFYVDDQVALGMRRLSIIDLSGGHQPVHNEDQSVWVVFNGEIYNYRDLRDDLIARGHQFQTASDTETIVHLYEQYGADCVQHLRGMFTFAIWDRRLRRLLVARDRLGIKPLYFAQRGPRLYFASEVKCLLQVPEIDGRLSWRAIAHLFSFLSTPDDESIIAGVKKLKPGHRLLAAPHRHVDVQPYWTLRFQPDATRSEADLADELGARVDAAVAEHMVSDVPLGAFLSGGVDSSAVVEAMSRLGGSRVRTFSIGFPEAEYNELDHARAVARACGADHHELVVDPDVFAVLDDVVWHLDEPFGDSSAIPTYMVSKLAAEHVTVVLSGDGGDELFAGYDRYAVEQRERGYTRVPRAIRRAAGWAASRLPEGTRGRRFLRHHALDGWHRYADSATLFSAEQRARLLTVEAARHVRGYEPTGELARELEQEPGHWLSRMQANDLRHYLPLDILTKVDRMSMAHSIEARVPLLDHRLVEFAATIPPELLLRDGSGKHLFKRALAGRLPASILHRAKRGFAVPLDRWFRGRLGPFLRELLMSRESRQRGLIDVDYVSALIDRHERGRELGLHLWTLVSFELWCRRFLDQRPSPPPRTARRRMVASTQPLPSGLVAAHTSLGAVR
jgi:asparagine synthase (glutamine-hydrolysing)